jgi:GNAT superfamily N-acetyltransferase
MRLERWEPGPDAAGLHSAYVAARAVDNPAPPPLSTRVFTGWLAAGWGGEPREVWFVPGSGGAVDGWYRLVLPDLENTSRANLDLVVAPDARRRGLGSELLRHALARAAAHRRSDVIGVAWDSSAGETFARAAGATRELTEVIRVQDVRRSFPAASVASGYSLLSWDGPVPEEYLERVAGVNAAMANAPRTAGHEEPAWTAQRVQERFNDVFPVFGLRAHSVAARHDASGDFAALTTVYVDPDKPAWGHQGITAVIRPHRGHRLGVTVKLAMLALLRETEPGLERIETDNGETNSRMIAVNCELGYDVCGPAMGFWRLAVPQS